MKKSKIFQHQLKHQLDSGPRRAQEVHASGAQKRRKVAIARLHTAENDAGQMKVTACGAW